MVPDLRKFRRDDILFSSRFSLAARVRLSGVLGTKPPVGFSSKQYETRLKVGLISMMEIWTINSQVGQARISGELSRLLCRCSSVFELSSCRNDKMMKKAKAGFIVEIPPRAVTIRTSIGKESMVTYFQNGRFPGWNYSVNSAD